MKYFEKETNKIWAEINTDTHEGVDNIQNILTQVLLCENLLILCGLGTSLCVTEEDGKPVASTMQDLWDCVKKLSEDKFQEIIEKVNYKKDSQDSIELLLSQCQIAEAFHPDKNVNEFIEAAEKLIIQRCGYDTSILNLSTHESFLRKVARRSTRQPRMKLFTTNYDRCFESAASNAGFTVIDGFSHSLPQEFDGSFFSYDLVKRGKDGDAPDFVPNVFQLYKMHGSVDWERHGEKIVKKINPERALIIYPRATKFESSYEPPFIELMANFQMGLRSSNTALMIVGCGLNDKHIVEPLMSAVRSNINLRLLLISLDLEKSTNKSIMTMRNLIEKGDSRLCLVDGAFESIVPLIPDLTPETEMERHEKRTKGMT